MYGGGGDWGNVVNKFSSALCFQLPLFLIFFGQCKSSPMRKPFEQLEWDFFLKHIKLVSQQQQQNILRSVTVLNFLVYIYYIDCKWHERSLYGVFFVYFIFSMAKQRQRQREKR